MLDRTELGGSGMLEPPTVNRRLDLPCDVFRYDRVIGIRGIACIGILLTFTLCVVQCVADESVGEICQFLATIWVAPWVEIVSIVLAAIGILEFESGREDSPRDVMRLVGHNSHRSRSEVSSM